MIKRKITESRPRSSVMPPIQHGRHCRQEECKVEETSASDNNGIVVQADVISSVSLPIIEATLMEEQTPEPVYDAVAILDKESEEEDIPRPWWRRRQRVIFAALLVIIIFY